MHPLFGRALPNALQAPLDYLERGAGFPIEPPRGHRRVERRLEGRDQVRKLLAGYAGTIQERRRPGLKISAPAISHRGYRLSSEAQPPMHRDALSCAVRCLPPQLKIFS
jgi:hypothetical protein